MDGARPVDAQTRPPVFGKPLRGFPHRPQPIIIRSVQKNERNSPWASGPPMTTTRCSQSGRGCTPSLALRRQK